MLCMERMEIVQNEGKIFENAIKSTVPDKCWIYRLRDNTSFFSSGTNTRFASTKKGEVNIGKNKI